MKKCLLLTWMAFYIAIAHAQVLKGTLLPGGTIGYNSSTSESSLSGTSSSKMTIIAPSLGFALSENKVFGMEFFYGHQNNNDNNNVYKQTYNEVGGGIFGRIYHPVLKKLFVFGQAGIGAHNLKQSTDQTNYPHQDRKGYQIYATMYPGLAYNITRKFQVETQFTDLIYFSYDRLTTTAASVKIVEKGLHGSLNFNGLGTLNFGFRFLLGK